MSQLLNRRIKQSRYESPHHEAFLSVLVAASYLDEVFDRVCADYGISRQQFNILRILRGAGPEGHQCGEIGVRMVDRSPDITRRIDGLSRSDHIQVFDTTNRSTRSG